MKRIPSINYGYIPPYYETTQMNKCATMFKNRKFAKFLQKNMQLTRLMYNI